jgi:hypothetical protein
MTLIHTNICALTFVSYATTAGPYHVNNSSFASATFAESFEHVSERATTGS